jgi:hypothetical protein
LTQRGLPDAFHRQPILAKMVHAPSGNAASANKKETNDNSTQISPVMAGLIVLLVFALPFAMYVGLYELRKLADLPHAMQHDEL